MLRWILLLGLVGLALWAVWSTRLPPVVTQDLPDPPKAPEPVPVAQPVVERLFGLWSAPESHFWSDNLRVGPPRVTRDETVPHGPRVAEQAGRTRPYDGGTQTNSDWVQYIRRILIGSGVINPLDKSFASSGVLERSICSTACKPKPLPTVEKPVFDGGDPTSSAVIILDSQGPTDVQPILYSGGNVNGQL